MSKKIIPPSTPDDDVTDSVLEIVALLLVIGWLLGVAADLTARGSIHLLLALASAIVAIRLVHRRHLD